MKHLFLLVFCSTLLLRVNAQQENPDVFLELTPYYTNNLSNMPYKNRLENNIPLNHYPIKEEPLSQSYYSWAAGVKVYKHLNKGWYAIVGMGFGTNRYKGTLDYTFQENNTNTQFTNQEDIIGMRGEIKLGIGKLLFLDADKKVFVLPEMLMGADGSWYDGSYTLGNYGFKYNYFSEELRVGVQMNLKLAYRFSKRFALGLTMKDLVNLHKSYSERRDIDGSTMKDQKVVFVLGQSLLPQINILFFF